MVASTNTAWGLTTSNMVPVEYPMKTNPTCSWVNFYASLMKMANISFVVALCFDAFLCSSLVHPLLTTFVLLVSNQARLSAWTTVS
jgi:hypothetical protein